MAYHKLTYPTRSTLYTYAETEYYLQNLQILLGFVMELELVHSDKKKNDLNDAPRNGEEWSVYSFKVRNKVDRGFQPVRRTERQRGKMEEAQAYRMAQGAYLDSRLHFLQMSETAQSQLRWWFASRHRIAMHHYLLRNYYLENRPTPLEDMLQMKFASTRKVLEDLRIATEMGSIEQDLAAKDKRKRVIYVTRGLVADTDNFFGRISATQEGMFEHWRKGLEKIPTEDGHRYTLEDYRRDFEAYREKVHQYVPDGFRDY